MTCSAASGPPSYLPQGFVKPLVDGNKLQRQMLCWGHCVFSKGNGLELWWREYPQSHKIRDFLFSPPILLGIYTQIFQFQQVSQLIRMLSMLWKVGFLNQELMTAGTVGSDVARQNSDRKAEQLGIAATNSWIVPGCCLLGQAETCHWAGRSEIQEWKTSVHLGQMVGRVCLKDNGLQRRIWECWRSKSIHGEPKVFSGSNFSQYQVILRLNPSLS